MCLFIYIYKLHFANGFFVGWITVSIEEPTTIVNELGTEGGENIIEKLMEINKTNRLTEKVY